MTGLEDVSATRHLEGEHRVIERVLDALENISGRMMRGGEVPVETLTKMIVFSQTFVDRCHHGKEESCLFPCLEKRGIPREGGPIEVMLYEHQVGRDLVGKIQAELVKHEETRTDAKEISRLCSEYVSHLRQHISKEEGILFRMGDGVMSAEDHESSLSCYERTEEEKLGEGKHQEMLRLADEVGSPAPGR